ncbi:MAG: YbaK/EbsC family protein [Candidatus Sumerlaea chitinivorans]|nr:YbaK/EbsC family protein [Candidatus Sumerlaea chitinivorans]
MTIAVRLKKLLDEAGIPYRVEQHPVAYTAQEVAQATHVSGKEFAKTVIVVADGKHLMVALPASHRIDLAALKDYLGCKDVRLATEHEFAGEFPDCEIGAMPPIGSLYSLRLLAAAPLKEDETILFNAGSHREAILMKREDWERCASPEWGDFARPA